MYENTKAEVLSLESDDEVDDGKPAEPNPELPKKKIIRIFSDVYQGNPIRRYTYVRTKLERVTAEVSRYKSEATIQIDEKPLLWWKAQESQYPLRSNLTK